MSEIARQNFKIMPANLQAAVPVGVMPFSLCTAFVAAREYAVLQNQYHDGTIQRSQLAQTSRRNYRLAWRLSASALAAMYDFWVSSLSKPCCTPSPPMSRAPTCRASNLWRSGRAGFMSIKFTLAFARRDFSIQMYFGYRLKPGDPGLAVAAVVLETGNRDRTLWGCTTGLFRHRDLGFRWVFSD